MVYPARPVSVERAPVPPRVTKEESGSVFEAVTCTRRVLIPMKSRTWSVLSTAVSTVRKPHARIPAA